MRAWCNGAIVDPDGPALSVLDHGVTVGDGVFEAMKVIDGSPFAMTRHLRRMTRSARGLGLPDPDHDLVRRAVREAVGDEPMPLGLVRITYTAGISPLGTPRDTKEPTLVVVAKPVEPLSPQTSVITVPWPRNEHGALAGLKTTSYGENVVALARAGAVGATEAIFANTVGNLCEGTGTNVFCVFDGVLATPPLTAGCLAGITRELVVEWCDVHERDITMAEFAEADEVFLTSSTRDVQAVVAVDDRDLSGRVRPLTQEVAEVWARRAPSDLDP